MSPSRDRPGRRTRSARVPAGGRALRAGGWALACAALLASAAPAAELRAGLGVAPLPAPDGGPLGGYGGLRDRRAEGLLDPPEARALVLERGELRVALVALDIVIARPDLRDAVLGRVEPLEIDALLLVATHTHSGPGGYVPGYLAERFTAGELDPQALEGLAGSATRALESAVASLAPARVASDRAKLELARNRRRAAGARETDLPVLRIDVRGAEPLVVFAYGMHPTALSAASRLYSADYVGPARAWLERRGWRPLFVPGPLGDQGPPLRAGGEVEHARALGEAVAGRVLETAESLRPGAAPELAALERWVELPQTRPRRFCMLWWLSPLVRGSLRRFLPERVPIHALRIGRARLLALPAEPSATVGEAVRAEVADPAVPFVIAHANDWIGYVVDAEAYRRGGYEACLSFHGPGTAAWLASETATTLRMLEARGG